MKVAYATDLHGIRRQYREFFELARQERVDLVIFGGDLLPIDGPFESCLADQLDFLADFLQPELEAFCRNNPTMRVFLLHGNNDWTDCRNALEEQLSLPNLFFVHNRRCTIDSRYQLIGYANVPPTPFRIKDHERLDQPGDVPCACPRGSFVSAKRRQLPVDPAKHFPSLPSVEQELRHLPFPTPEHQGIYLMHAPPYATGLDLMTGGIHVGSRAIRAFIEKLPPSLTLHGHIHEAPDESGRFLERIGSSICVNAGHNPERLYAVTFSLEDVPGTIRHTVFKR